MINLPCGNKPLHIAECDDCIRPEGTIEIDANGLYDATEYASASVNVPSGEGRPDDVRFIDYDGTIVQQYSAAEFAEVTELPENPSHDGLVAQGWNYTLNEIHAEIADHGKCDIGQLYVTNSGATEIDVTLKDGRLSPYVSFGINGEATIDWGDGSPVDTKTGSNLNTIVDEQHVYAAAGDYTIKILVVQGKIKIYSNHSLHQYPKILWAGVLTGSLTYAVAIHHVRLGHDVVLGNSAFKSCRNLETVSMALDTSHDVDHMAFESTGLGFITIPPSWTILNGDFASDCDNLETISLPPLLDGFEGNGRTFGDDPALNRVILPKGFKLLAQSAFTACLSLHEIALPDGVTYLGHHAFSYSGLEKIKVPSGFTRITGQEAFSSTQLREIVFPEGFTTISASRTFEGCYSLEKVQLPSTLTAIPQDTFHSCFSLKEIVIPEGITTLENQTFYWCYSLEKVVLPSTLTSIGREVFSDCDSLQKVDFPDTLTSIGYATFEGCTGLTSVTIPSAVTTISDRAFRGCVGILEFHMKPTTPPTISSGTFPTFTSDHVIYVPQGTLADYQSASIWSNYAAYMQEE